MTKSLNLLKSGICNTSTTEGFVDDMRKEVHLQNKDQQETGTF